MVSWFPGDTSKIVLLGYWPSGAVSVADEKQTLEVPVAIAFVMPWPKYGPKRQNQPQRSQYFRGTSKLSNCVQDCSGLFFTRFVSQKIRSFTEDREKFEQIVTFLGSVPLFKKQLPTSELPKVAQMLEEHTWKPDEKLVSQGAMGSPCLPKTHRFFLENEGSP